MQDRKHNAVLPAKQKTKFTKLDENVIVNVEIPAFILDVFLNSSSFAFKFLPHLRCIVCTWMVTVEEA